MHLFRRVWEAVIEGRRQYGIFGFDREADIRSARLLNAIARRDPLPDREAETLGLALHYLYGAALGICFGVLSRRVPRLSSACGLPFGTAVWLFGDEFAITAAGISNPLRRPPASHVSALAAHLLFGAVVRYSCRYEGVCRQ